MRRWKRKYYIALGLFVVSWILWPIAIVHASNSHFTEDYFALEILVLAGAVSMVVGSIADLWSG
jgi:hypothetical protein